jgi:hypothetical protein
MKLLRNIWDWTWKQLVGEVPEDDAICAFDCRKPQCTEGEWENCARRLDSVAERSKHAKQPPSEAVID